MTDGTDHTASARRRRSPLDPRRLPLRHRIGLLALLVLAVLPLGNALGITAIGVFGLVTVPLSVGPLTLLQLTSALYFAMFAMSWDAVSGYTGQISFGHGLFFAVGGYTSALLNLGHGIDPVLSVPAGVVMAALAGVVVGVPALRLRGPYLSLVTLVAPLILLQLFIFYSDIFGGELGLRSPDNMFGFGLNEAVPVYYVAFGLFVVVTAVLLAVTRSDAGMVFTGIREDETAIAAAGINPAKFKTFAFVLSAAVGGLAGAMFVHTPVGNPQPSQLLALTVSLEVIIASVLGGMGTIVGAAVGGIFIVLFRNRLSNVEFVVPVFDASISELDFLVFAVVTLVLLFVLPGGVLRWAIRAGRRVLRRLRSVTADGGTDPADSERGTAPTDVDRTPVHQVRDKYRRYYEEWRDRGRWR